MQGYQTDYATKRERDHLFTMPTQDNEDPEGIRMKVLYSGAIFITSIGLEVTYEDFCAEIKDICKFDDQQPFTMKWLDEEGDPCTISTQIELDEAIRLYEINKDSEITVHVFPNVPERPGMPCIGEDRNMYRKGARRWRKIYRVNGHLFQAKRFSKKAFCSFCSDRIWGLGRQGYRCMRCKLAVHKRCHKLLKVVCGAPVMPNNRQEIKEDAQYLPPPYPVTVNSKDANGDTGTSVDVGIKDAESSNQSSEESPVIAQPSNGADSHQVTMDQFELLRVIGRGSYAKVLMVEQKRTKRVYAMKVIKKELVNEDEDIDWVQTEKHVFETATNYPFLVGLHSCFQTPSRLFFVIEFVSGGDLMFHMQRQRRLPEEHARFYSAEICLALNFLHERGIVYRDLKLDNVLLDHEGHIKLTDYGMCKDGMRPGDTTSTFCGTPNYIAPEILRGNDYGRLASRRRNQYVLRNSKLHSPGNSPRGRLCRTFSFILQEGLWPGDRTNTFCGTPNYIAPEVLRGEEYDFSVDWWALGVLMFEMLAGRSPFDVVGGAENPDQNSEDYLFQIILEKTIRIPRSLSVKAASILKGFLNKNPSERLGCHHQTGFADIQSHPFFRTINWDLLEQKQITPPYKPPLRSERDLEHFDPAFTDEPVQLTPDDPKVIEKIEQSEFDGFEYVNPLLMSMEDCV
ncbi:hypothetical protein FSP39_015074 [Pinctada imbricata]|uniref:Protein kinase C n=1 Tax=Pinctada imbricata TaxID=66713 RepID=A0AA89C1K8_PINIB|nr:hypothetical protein FSP39_015074 [Pinctada imbricata]